MNNSTEGFAYAPDLRLWDSQWVNVVNCDYSGMTVEEAVNAAVKMTERLMAENLRNDKWPPKQGESA